MGARTASLERQYENAKSRLAHCESELTAAGVDAAALGRHPRWRSVRADCRAIARRLNRAREIENFGQSAPES
jgi:hypothetical protein